MNDQGGYPRGQDPRGSTVWLGSFVGDFFGSPARGAQGAHGAHNFLSSPRYIVVYMAYKFILYPLRFGGVADRNKAWDVTHTPHPGHVWPKLAKMTG